MSTAPTQFQRGQLVTCRQENGTWRQGIATDVFRGPVTGQEVVVMGGDGYYVEDVREVDGIMVRIVPEPQSLRA